MEYLTKYRDKLNVIDQKLIQLLGERVSIIKEVGEYKKDNDIPMMQSDRVIEVKKRCAQLGREFQLDESFIHALYDTIIGEACRIENIIIDGKVKND